MKLKLEESYPGEFDDTNPIELLDKWERAASACQCSMEQLVSKSLGLPSPEDVPIDAQVDGLTELISRLTKGYEDRLRKMAKSMVSAVEKGSQHRGSEVLERSEGIYSDDEMHSMIMRAFSGMRLP